MKFLKVLFWFNTPLNTMILPDICEARRWDAATSVFCKSSTQLLIDVLSSQKWQYSIKSKRQTIGGSFILWSGPSWMAKELAFWVFEEGNHFQFFRKALPCARSLQTVECAPEIPPVGPSDVLRQIRIWWEGISIFSSGFVLMLWSLLISRSKPQNWSVSGFMFLQSWEPCALRNTNDRSFMFFGHFAWKPRGISSLSLLGWNRGLLGELLLQHELQPIQLVSLFWTALHPPCYWFSCYWVRGIWCSPIPSLLLTGGTSMLVPSRWLPD